MGINKLKDDFIIFRDHCIVIRRDYNTYNLLFFSGYDEILKKIACNFFYDLSEILRRDWLMQVCKLFDPAQNKFNKERHENISINLINYQLEKYGLISDEIHSLSERLFVYGKKIIPARNKRLAHFDRTHHVKQIILGCTKEKELNDFLKNLQKYSDAVGRKIGIGPLDFSSSCCSGDVLDFLQFIRHSYRQSYCDKK